MLIMKNLIKTTTLRGVGIFFGISTPAIVSVAYAIISSI